MRTSFRPGTIMLSCQRVGRSGSGQNPSIPAGTYTGFVNCIDRMTLLLGNEIVSDETAESLVYIPQAFGDLGGRLSAHGRLVSPGDEYEWKSEAYSVSTTVQHVHVTQGQYIELAENDLQVYGERPLILSGKTRTAYVLNVDGSLQYTSQSFMTTPRGPSRSAILRKLLTGILTRR